MKSLCQFLRKEVRKYSPFSGYLTIFLEGDSKISTFNVIFAKYTRIFFFAECRFLITRKEAVAVNAINSTFVILCELMSREIKYLSKIK